MRTFRIATGLVAVGVMLGACSGAATPATRPTETTTASAAPAAGSGLTIYAAASLKGALVKVRIAWEAANPTLPLTISTDSSSALETKIEQGAPADLLLSADTANPKKLVDGGFAAGDLVTFAGNHLTVIVPADNPARIAAPSDLAKTGIKIIAGGDKVPITKYATQLVDNLAKVPGYPGDFAARYAANIVSKEDNVAAIVSKIELGEGDAGIVYVTDAKSATGVAQVAIPDDANVPATYGGVVVKASAHGTDAARFLSWLAGPDGQAILASFGFLPPS